ncbi:MAG TPA: metal-dependent hydrolase, partial [Phycisphaerales bacterium]|nr:metal-dependent hydrolase [Phycisphaerales bacterium]
MTLKITFHGHSTFSLSDGTSNVLIDPFFTGNPQAKVTADEISCTHVLLSHGHEDHMTDAVSIA